MQTLISFASHRKKVHRRRSSADTVQTMHILIAAAVLVFSHMAVGYSGPELTVFYEQSEASYGFIANEIVPTVLFINKYSGSSTKLAVNLKPYTTYPCSTSIGNEKFCAQVKLQACASSSTFPGSLPNDWKRLSFVSCVANPANIPQGSKDYGAMCAFNACVDWPLLAFCGYSADGDVLMDANLQDFNKLKTNSTSTQLLLLNTGTGASVLNADDQEKGVNNLMALLCEKVPSFFKGCSKARVKSKKQFNFLDKFILFPRICDLGEPRTKFEKVRN